MIPGCRENQEFNVCIDKFFVEKVQGFIHFVAFSANLRGYQHVPALVEDPDDLVSVEEGGGRI